MSAHAADRAWLRVPEERVGTDAMLLFILTEAMLFLMLFFTYVYLAQWNPRWPLDEPPKLTLALCMLGILWTSSAVLYWGERRAKAGAIGAARGALAATIALGVAFLVLQAFEYADHLKHLTPATDAYGSIFYTITSLHGAHVVLGLLMLCYVLLLPRIEHAPRPPHRALHNASLYWHFVDAVWGIIVVVLYLTPNFLR